MSGKTTQIDEDRLELIDNIYTDLLTDNVGDGYLRMTQSISFSELCAYTVQLPLSEHWRPEVKVTKKAEIRNLLDCETFQEVKDKGQTTVGSRWVLTEKEAHNGHKQKCKARLVA